jgi:hypothetical protein
MTTPAGLLYKIKAHRDAIRKLEWQLKPHFGGTPPLFNARVQDLRHLNWFVREGLVAYASRVLTGDEVVDDEAEEVVWGRLLNLCSVESNPVACGDLTAVFFEHRYWDWTMGIFDAAREVRR